MVEFGPYDLRDKLPEVVRRYGQPFRMSSMLLYDSLSAAVSAAECRVLLTGEGADELFLGYDSYAQLFGRSRSLSSNAVLRRFYMDTRHARMIRGLLPESAWQEIEQQFMSWASRFDGKQSVDALRSAERELSLEPLLLRSDVMMMSRSVEARMPFLHGSVASYAAQLHQQDLIKEQVTKYALRSAFSPYTNGLVKTPFRASLTTWFSGALRVWISNKASKVQRCFTDLGFRSQPLRALFTQAIDGNEAAASVAFSCIVLYEWLETKG
ncbi:hypothetical protein PRtIB026_A28990 [Pseudomonas sp. RtIB026]|nr:hypothetical protein PRtIB026_A28990 [Pseudomonas sp. RtIB026]